jgi:hypothetical protein
MKKLSILICFLFITGAIYLQSCSPEQGPCNGNPHDNDIDLFEADEALYEAQMNVCDFIYGGTDSTTGTYYSCEAIAIIISAGGSADYGTGGRMSSRNKIYSQNACSKTNINQVILPDEYKIAANPFEYVGIIHNRNMFQILTSPNKEIELNKILDGDNESLERIISIFLEVKQTNISNEERQKLKNQLKQSLFNNRNKVTNFKSLPFSEAYANLNLPENIITFNKNIFSEVKAKMKETNNNTRSVINLINSKITEILNESNIEDESSNNKLRYLSLLKHSYYYWYN